MAVLRTECLATRAAYSAAQGALEALTEIEQTYQDHSDQEEYQWIVRRTQSRRSSQAG